MTSNIMIKWFNLCTMLKVLIYESSTFSIWWSISKCQIVDADMHRGPQKWASSSERASSTSFQSKNDNSSNDFSESIAILESELQREMQEALNSDLLQGDALAPWQEPSTWAKVASLPHQAQMLALMDITKKLFKQMKPSYLDLPASEHLDLLQQEEEPGCKLPILGQMARLVLGNFYGQIPVPWLSAFGGYFAGFDQLRVLLPFTTGHKLVLHFLNEMKMAKNRQTLVDCGWQEVEQQCVIEQADTDEEGQRVHVKTKNCHKHWNNRLGSLAHTLNEDRTMIAINPEGLNTSTNDLIKPKTCAFISQFTNDEYDVDHNYNVYKQDITKWKKGNGTQLGIKEAKSLAAWKPAVSGLTHYVFGGTHREYVVVQKTNPYQTIQQMMMNGSCSSVVFVGASLGGRLAMMARIDLGQVDEQGKYTDKCIGNVPCSVISLAGGAPFFGDNVPELRLDVRDQSCNEGKPAQRLRDVLVFTDSDQVPLFPNPLFYPYDRWPEGRKHDARTEKGWSKAVSAELVKEFQHIKGVSIIEIRKEIGVKMSDGVPTATDCAYSTVAPCNTTIWQYYNSPQFLEYNQKSRKPIKRSPDGLFYGCGSIMFLGVENLARLVEMDLRWCGHLMSILPFYMDFLPDGEKSECDSSDFKFSVPMAEGSHLSQLYLLSKVPKAIVKTLQDIRV